MKKRATILNIGDEVDYDSFKKLDKEKRCMIRHGFDYRSVDYQSLLDGRMPDISTEKVIIYFFFPFEYWNRHIEYRTYRGVYGNRTFYRKFERFCRMAVDAVKECLPGRKILFVDDLLLSVQGRDKTSIMRKLGKAGIPVPRQFRTRSVRQVQELIEKGHKLYIKPSCGSMGKGITFLQCGDWQTNFKFKNGMIVSRKSDKGWQFHDVTDNGAFLKKLLKTNIYIEEGIDSMKIKDDKVDLRAYTFFDKTLYIYPRRNKIDAVTTNISQGGKGDPGLLKVIPRKMLERTGRTALKAMKALGLNFAGIDVVVDSALKSTYVVDVNMFPGFPKRRTFNLSRKMVTELHRLGKEGKLHFDKIDWS